MIPLVIIQAFYPFTNTRPSSTNTGFPIYCTTEKSTLLGMAHILFISLTKIFRLQMFENGTDKKLKNIIAIFKYADTGFQSIN